MDIDLDDDAPSENVAATADNDLDKDLRAALAEAKGDAKERPAEADKSGKPASERQRDDHGRFAPKAGDKPAGEPTEPKPAAEAHDGTAAAATRKAPVGWDHTTFATLPPAIQDQILKRETDYSKGIQHHAEKAKAYDAIDQVIAPHRDAFARRGMAPAQGIAVLLQAQAALDHDPVNALAQIARSYGIDLSRPLSTQAVRPQTPNPAEQRLARLEAHLQQQAQAEQHRHAQSIQSDIARFAQDPANRHFPAVEAQMAALIRSGQASDMKDAYEKAIWLEPSIREQLLAERAAPAAAQAQAAKDQEAVKRAKDASGSVKGAPAGRNVSAKAGKGGLEDDIRAAIAQYR